MARENSAALKNARLDVSSARYQKAEALGEYFPTVTAQAYSFHAVKPLIDIGLPDIIGTSDNAWNISNAFEEFALENDLKSRYTTLHYAYGASVSAIQPLYAGGRIVNGNRLARLGIEAASLQLSMAERSSEADVESKYWRVVSLQEKMVSVDKALSVLDSLHRDASVAFESGLLTSSEMLTVETKLRELKSTRVQLRSGITLAKMDLLNMIGAEYSVLGLDKVVLSDSLEDFQEPMNYYVPEEEMAARMQEMSLLDLQVQAKTLEKKMTLGEALPQVGIGATYGYGALVGSAKANGAVFATVQIPLSDWGKKSQKLRRQQNEIDKAVNQREYLSAQLLLKARSLWVALEAAWEALESAESARALASDTLEKIQGQKEAGLVTVSDLLQAELALRQAEDALVDARIAYRSALDEYLRY